MTDDELVDTFGACTSDQVTVRGQWKYQTTLFSDQLIRIRADVEDTPENWTLMRDLKESLKARFEQVDIWITAHRVDII